MRFRTESELQLFAASVRGALAGFDPPTEPALGTWWDERDGALDDRLRALGWERLWLDRDLLGPTVAGAIELGRGLAPLCALDEASLGAPLCVDRRARHARGHDRVAVPLRGGGLALATVDGPATEEPTLDGTGTVVGLDPGAPLELDDGRARLRCWGVATLGYLAGVADAALEQALAHVRTREQFGAPLGALAAVRGRLAEAALRRDGLALVAWSAATADEGVPDEALAWAGAACREVTAEALQVHGGVGFALESGVHRHYRRARSAQAWVDAVLDGTAT